MENYSVLMTVYKGDNPEFARLSFNSMFNQTVKSNDFVVVCDGPLTNELNNLLQEYQNKYNDIFRVYRFEENRGLGEALKFGLPKCKNRLVARMDDDDIAHLDRCEKQLLFFEKHPEINLLGSYCNEFEESPTNIIRVKSVPLKQDEILSFSKRRNPFNHPTIMMDRDKILSVGNYSSMRTNQDVELWIRALNNGILGENIPEPLVDFRFDKKTYQRRKDHNNVKLMVEVWKGFYQNKYCSFYDYIYVLIQQYLVFLAPQKLIEWAYNNLR